MRRLLWVSPMVVIPAALASGPPTNTDVVTSAGDAFGITLGPESIGLYGPGSIRGFNPLSAGNVRIDGLYFDLQGGMIDRLATDTRIRVGLSATSFPWPAPSGIVDYTLREAKAAPQITSITYAGPYETYDFDLDGSGKLLDDQLRVAAGVSYHSDQFNPSQTARTVSWGVLPKWSPSVRVSISTFLGRQSVSDAKPQATLYPQPGQSLPPISPHYYGPPWANSDSISEHYGMLVKAELSTHWALRCGIFHSRFDLPISYFDLYLNTTAGGMGNHDLVVEPTQHYGSGSGELQLSYRADWKEWQEKILFGARGRSVKAQYGGADAFDLGVGPIEHAGFVLPSGYAFGATTSGRIHEYSFGTSYALDWIDHVKLTAALRRDSYSSEVVDPVVGASTTSLRPWLYNSNLVVLPSRDLEIFSALTRGLEDSGVAPVEAVNRGQVLRATRSSQEEVGAKYSPTPSVSVLAGVFNVEKSYFALDEQDVFSALGVERHRGVEFSFIGEFYSRLHVVIGTMLMSPEVLAQPTSNEVIGRTPIGQPHWMGQAGLDYQFSEMPSVSIDGVFTSAGRRVATVDNQVVVPGYGYLDLGVRYRFNLGQHAATLRMQVLNITNDLSWGIGADGGLWRVSGRRGWAYLIVDF